MNGAFHAFADIGKLARIVPVEEIEASGFNLNISRYVIPPLQDDLPTVVTATSRLRTALDYADALRPFGLCWYEEPGDPLDYQLQATLAEYYPLPLATGENLFSLIDARNLIRYGGLRPDREFVPAAGAGVRGAGQSRLLSAQSLGRGPHSHVLGQPKGQAGGIPLPGPLLQSVPCIRGDADGRP